MDFLQSLNFSDQSSSNIDTTPKSLNTQLVPAREKVERLLLSDVEEEAA